MKKKKINLLILNLVLIFSFGASFSQPGASGFTPTRNKQSFTSQESFNFLEVGFLPTWVTPENVYNPDFLVRLDVYRKFARIGIIKQTNTAYNALYRKPFRLKDTVVCNEKNLTVFLRDSFKREKLRPGYYYIFNYLLGESIDNYKERMPYDDEYVAVYHGIIIYSFVCHNANGDPIAVTPVIKSQLSQKSDSFETGTKPLEYIHREKITNTQVVSNVSIKTKDTTVIVPNLRVRYRDTIVEGIRYRLEYEDSTIRIKKYVLKNDTIEVPVTVEKLKIIVKEKDSFVYVPKITIQENKNTIPMASSTQKTIIPPPPATMIPPPPAYMHVPPPACTAPVPCACCGQYHQQTQNNCCEPVVPCNSCSNQNQQQSTQEQKLVGSGQIIEK